MVETRMRTVPHSSEVLFSFVKRKTDESSKTKANTRKSDEETTSVAKCLEATNTDY
jgi:hypothetical protein